MEQKLNTESIPQPPVFFITGEQGEGKTTLLLAIVAELKQKGVQVRGFAAPGTFSHGLRDGFSLLDLATGRSEEFCSRTPLSGSRQHGPYYFRSDVISHGYRILTDARDTAETDLLVIDEVGRFELNGEIWSGCIDHLFTMPLPPMIWTVRRCFLSDVVKRWPVRRSMIIEPGSAEVNVIGEEICAEVMIHRSYRQNDERRT